MKILIFLFLLPTFIYAQDAYTRWIAIQEGSGIHLLETCKEKRVYGSESGKSSDLKLRQYQKYEQGRLVKDMMYVDYPQLMYNIEINYQQDGTATGINLEDSSIVTYAFTPEQKLRYYVVDRQNDMHVVYTYDDDGDLIRCKDCLAPFNNHDWCAYYNYFYNDKKQLIKTASHNLEKGAAVTTKVVFETDSLVYKNNRLTTRWTINAAGEEIKKATYTYNKKGLLVEEYSTQLAPYQNPRSYLKTYVYHCNGQLKKVEEVYYTNKHINGKQVSKYNNKGQKIRQESYKGTDNRTKLYLIKYKR